MYGSWKEHLNHSGKPADNPTVMPWLFSKPYRRQHPQKASQIKARFTKDYLPRNSEAFERQMKANVEHNTKGQLHDIDVPTLIMVGKHDELTPPRIAKALKSEMPHAKLLVFQQGGHGLYWEIPTQFNKAVYDFINSNT